MSDNRVVKYRRVQSNKTLILYMARSTDNRPGCNKAMFANRGIDFNDCPSIDKGIVIDDYIGFDINIIRNPTVFTDYALIDVALRRNQAGEFISVLF